MGDPVGADAMPAKRVDPATQPNRGIDRTRVDAFIERALADAPGD